MGSRKLNGIILVIFSILTISLIAFSSLFFVNHRLLSDNQKMRFELLLLRDEFRKILDERTGFARVFVITGDPELKKNYENVLSKKSGNDPAREKIGKIFCEVADGKQTEHFDDFLEDNRLTKKDAAQLKIILKDSLRIFKTETAAINMFRGFYNDGTGKFTKKGRPDKEGAIDLLYGDSYHNHKAQILKSINDLFKQIDSRLHARIVNYEHKSALYLNLIIIFSFAILILIIIVFAFEGKKVAAYPEIIENNELLQEKEAIESSLRESEKRSRALSDLAFEATMIVIDKKIVEANRAAITMFGCSCLEEMKNVDNILGRIHPDCIGKVLNQVNGNFSEISTVKLFGKNDREFWAEIRGLMIEYNGMEAIGITVRDVTARIQAEEALRESEQRSRLLSELAVEGIIVYQDNEIIDANRTLTEMLGYFSLEDIRKLEKITDLIEPDFREEVVRKIEDDSQETYVIKMLRKDGSSFWAEVRGSVFEYRGEKTRFTSIIDITSRLQMEEALLESERKFRQITISVLDAIILMDNDGRVIYWNPAAERVFGYSEKEILGQNLHKILAPQKYHESYNSALHSWKIGGEGNIVGKITELTAMRKDGSEFQVELSLSSVKIGNKWNAIAVMRDISDRKRFEKDLIEAKNEADRANRAKSEFLANMSHEIRTPMNAIIGFSDLLKGRIKDEKSLEYLQGILSGGKSLLDLIDDILDLSKIEAGRMDIKWELVNPHAFCEEMAAIFAVKTAEKEIGFRVEVSPELPGGLVLDEVRVRQILFNLIGNAVKFTEKGEVTLCVRTENPASDSSSLDLILEVIDTGIGVPHEQLKTIFEAFRQQEGQSTRRFGGTGLGLTITKRLVAMMNGRISVESEAGKGSKFKVVIPGVKVASIEPEDGREINDYENIQFQGAVVLLVEDIESNRRIVNDFLETHDLSILTASNGQKGLELAHYSRPDLILMDLQMPVMDGYEATRMLKNDPDYGSIPIIALTASSTNVDEKKIKPLFDGYLRKPVSKSEILMELAKFLPHSHEKKEPASENAVEPLETFAPISGETLRILTEEFEPLWEEVSSGMLMEDIISFARRIKDLGSSQDAPFLQEYGNLLHQHAASFKIDLMLKTLEKFPQMIRKARQAEGKGA